ncbi:MAG: hypothetical protein ISP99_00745 [Pseudomonadales bacterium]|nr:hypothetical protein [Pseudomonadales bacterium]
MNELLNRVVNLSALPDAVCRRLHRARELVDADQIQVALDRFAVTLTAHLQDKNPLVIALLPDSAMMLGTLMQRTVFAQQVVFAEFSASGLRRIGDWPSLKARTVVLLDAGRLSAGDYQRVAQELGKHALTAIWLCRLIKATTDDLPDGFDESLSVLSCDEQNVFGCGLEVLGYCRNLPGLYAYD